MKKLNTKELTIASIMTAMVIVFQLIATFTTFFGPFSTALALIPIVIGAAMCGAGVGAWLGFVFGMVVLLSGGANLFFMFNVPGTIITVLAKGTLCGFMAGFVYRLGKKINRYFGALCSALICPITNTAVFLLGSAVFFFDSANKIAEVVGIPNSGFSVFMALALANFVFEILLNVVLCPVIVRLLNIRKK